VIDHWVAYGMVILRADIYDCIINELHCLFINELMYY